MLNDFGTPKTRILDFTSQFSETQAGLKEKAEATVKKFLHDHRDEYIEEIYFTDEEEKEEIALDKLEVDVPQAIDRLA